MDFLAAASATATATATASTAATPINNNNTNSNSSNTTTPLNTPLPPPLISSQQQQQLPQQQQQQPLHLQPQSTNPMNSTAMDYNHPGTTSMMPPATAPSVTVAPPLPVAPHRPLENLMIYENFDVHESHRVEDGFCTQLSRLPPKKQELLKQFGIQTNQTVTYYEKYILIENFNRFCNVSKETIIKQKI